MVNTDSAEQIDRTSTLCDLLAKRVERSGSEQGLFFKQEQEWISLTWDEFNHLLTQARSMLDQAGCRCSDRIGIMAGTGVLWDLCQHAILQTGGVVVGLDPHDTPENLTHIIHTAGIRGVIVDSDIFQGKISSCPVDLDFVLHVEYSRIGGLQVSGEQVSTSAEFSLPGVSHNSTATIIFTSGTTGTPKGIEYSHAQVILACRAILSRYPEVTSGAHLPCWLPLSNLFQRMLNFCGISVGAKIFYVSNPVDIAEQLPEINPDVLIGVPRFYEKLHAGIIRTMEMKPWLIRKVFAGSLWLHGSFPESGEESGASRWRKKLADAMILKKVRERIFGTRLLYVVSGSAPMPVWLLHWYASLGVLILEAYGISENIVPIACNTLDAYRFGTVGRVIEVNSVRISDDDELLVKGPGVFHGYLNAEEQDKFTPDGYYKTGDEVSLDQEGFVTLRGRKSDFFKTSTGRRVCPAGLEAALLQLDAFEHVLILGEGKKVPIILATLSAESSTDIQDVDFAALRRGINSIAESMSPSWARPAALVLLNEPFTLADGELTPNLKLRRQVVVDKYTPFVDMAYQYINSEDSSDKGVYMLKDSQGGIVLL
jgi:long-chain acyl-CoA synthetase